MFMRNEMHTTNIVCLLSCHHSSNALSRVECGLLDKFHIDSVMKAEPCFYTDSVMKAEPCFYMDSVMKAEPCFQNGQIKSTLVANRSFY